MTLLLSQMHDFWISGYFTQTLMMLRGILWSCHFAHSHDPKKTDSYEVILVHIVCGPWAVGHPMIVQLTSNKHHAIPSFESKRKGSHQSWEEAWNFVPRCVICWHMWSLERTNRTNTILCQIYYLYIVIRLLLKLHWQKSLPATPEHNSTWNP